MPESRRAMARRRGSGRAIGAATLLVALASSGCATTAPGPSRPRPAPTGPASARLQEPDAPVAVPARPSPPASTIPPSPAANPAPDQPAGAEDDPKVADAPAAPPAARAADRSALRNSPALQGLSSIARNRAVNRMLPAQPEEEEADFPDIRDDPLGRAGVPILDRDPFLFPWLMNLIFEDRWNLEKDPVRARSRRIRSRATVDIRDPDPDTANFPNGAYTLPKGRMYIENNPVGFYAASKYAPGIYEWSFLVRYGLTDNLEFRIFSNGLTVQSPQGKTRGTTGFSPLALDFKANFWEENPRYHVPAFGVELYLQTTFGSPTFDAGTQPSINLLFDQSLPMEIGFEYNFGITGTQNASGQVAYQFSFQWSFQREVLEDFDIFVHGFYNAAALPRVLNFRESAGTGLPTINVVGVGGIWTVNDRLAIFGSYNFGTTTGSPATIALTGFAVAF